MESNPAAVASIAQSPRQAQTKPKRSQSTQKLVHTSARERLSRVFLVTISVGTALISLSILPGDEGMLHLNTLVPAAVTAVTLAVAIFIPIISPFFLIVMQRQTVRRIVFINSLAFIAVQVIWPLTIIDPPSAAPPWTQSLPAFQAIAFTLSVRAKWAWIYAVIQGPVIMFTEYAATEKDFQRAALDGVSALTFCLIATGITLAILKYGYSLDTAFKSASTSAALEASQQTQALESVRVNALVHDDVLSVLQATGRDTPVKDLQEQSEVALTSIGSLFNPEERENYTGTNAAIRLRSALSRLAPELDIESTVDNSVTIPAHVMSAVTEAAAEALRNSLIHARHEEERTVNREANFMIDDTGVHVTIRDDGRGFSLAAIPTERLGIKTSIVGRMNALPQGYSRILSKPGNGATVEIGWDSHE